MNNRRCDKCMWWDRLKDTDTGLCRFHAPQPAGIPAINNEQALWPISIWDDWCGSYEYDATKDKE